MYIVNRAGFTFLQGEPLCIFYSRYGICKFGPNCKFDHPMGIFTYNLSPSSSSADAPVVRRLMDSSRKMPSGDDNIDTEGWMLLSRSEVEKERKSLLCHNLLVDKICKFISHLLEMYRVHIKSIVPLNRLLWTSFAAFCINMYVCRIGKNPMCNIAFFPIVYPFFPSNFI